MQGASPADHGPLAALDAAIRTPAAAPADTSASASGRGSAGARRNPCERWQSTRRGTQDALQVRPITPEDAPLLNAMVRSASRDSRYRRFLVGLSELPQALLDRLVRVDPREEIALLATLCRAGREVAVAEARLVRGDAGPRSLEFALMVADALQGHGVGTKLLRRLIACARRRGARELYGDVLLENRPMLELAARFGFKPARHPGDARLLRVRLELESAAGA